MAHQSKTKRNRLSWPILFLSLLSVWACFVVNFGHQRTGLATSNSILYNALETFKSDVDQAKTRPDYHVIFSTGCSLQQDWESYVFFYHAYKVNQPGNVTRLVSGCTPKEERKLRNFHQEKIRTMSDRFHVFFTRNFGRESSVFKEDYKYNNKPNSIYLWMKDILGMDQENRTKDIDDGIILLLDPDMILLRPLLHDFTDQEMIYPSKEKDGASLPPNGSTRIVQHGMPMAQQDGYLSDEWMKFNVSYITQGGTFPSFRKHDGPFYWNSGPPYLSTVRDMWKMVFLWKDYVPRVYEEYPKLFAEMYGLIIAAVHLNLPHTLVQSIVVSEIDTEDREGWKFVDALADEEVCNVKSWSNNPRMPIVLHYCGRYGLGKFFFSKYRLKKKYLSCETPLLTMPPPNAHQILNYWARPPPDRGQSHEMTVKHITKGKAKREAFMLCGLIHSINEAARYYKTNHCNGNGNFSEVYNFHDDPYST